MKRDNTAERLVNLLRRAKKINSDMQSGAAWNELFGTTRPVEIFRKKAQLMELIEQAAHDIRAVVDDDASTDHWESRLLDQILANNFGQPWRSLSDQFDEHTLNYLSLSSRLLGGNALDSNSLQDYLARVNELLTEVKNEPDLILRKYLFEALRRIKTALEDYELTGSEEVLSVMEGVIGRAVMDKGLGETLKSSDIGNKFRDLVVDFANAVTIVSGLYTLAPPVAKLLGAV